LAEALVAKLKECAPAIGLDIGSLTALETQLGNLTVTSRIGARITEANVGTFKTGDISVGDPSRK
jgi:flagellar motor component MotA